MTKEEIKDLMFTEVEISNDDIHWARHVLCGYLEHTSGKYINENGIAYKFMRPVETKKLKPIDLLGWWWKDDGGSIQMIFKTDGKSVESMDWMDYFSKLREVKDQTFSPSPKGPWRTIKEIEADEN